MNLEDISLNKIKTKFGTNDEVFMKRVRNSGILPFVYIWLLKKFKEEKKKVISVKDLEDFTKKDVAQCRIYINFFVKHNIILEVSKNGKLKNYALNPTHEYKETLEELDLKL